MRGPVRVVDVGVVPVREEGTDHGGDGVEGEEEAACCEEGWGARGER